MSSDVATALGAAFVASILTITGSLLVARYQAHRAAEQERLRREHENEQARLADQRTLRDAKRERLRGDYVALIFANNTILSASMQLMLLEAGDTTEARQGRLRDQLAQATDDLGGVIARLKLETGTEYLLEAYGRVRGLWFTYQLRGIRGGRQA